MQKLAIRGNASINSALAFQERKTSGQAQEKSTDPGNAQEQKISRSYFISITKPTGGQELIAYSVIGPLDFSLLVLAWREVILLNLSDNGFTLISPMILTLSCVHFCVKVRPGIANPSFLAQPRELFVPLAYFTSKRALRGHIY